MGDCDDMYVAQNHWNDVARKQAEAELERWEQLSEFDPVPICPACAMEGPEIEYKPPPVFRVHDSEEFIAQHAGTLRHTCGRCKCVWITKTSAAGDLRWRAGD